MAEANENYAKCRQQMRTQYLDLAASLTADFLEKTMIHTAGLP